MKDKTYILNFALAVLFVSSIVGNLILFNQYSNSKQTLAAINSQLEVSEGKDQDAQSDWKTLQASLTDAQNENTRLVALKNGQPPAQVPVDPNKMLVSGVTLQQAKQQIDGVIASCKAAGYSTVDTNTIIAQTAKDLGTSMDEINKLPATQAAPITKPATTKPATTKPSTTQPSTTQPSTTPDQSKVGVDGAFPKTSTDKNGNGIEDSLESVTGIGSGGTTSDPNFNLSSN